MLYVRRAYTYARNTSALVKLCESGSLLDLRAYIDTLKQHDLGKFVLTRMANARGFITPTVPLIICVKQGNYPMALELLTTIPGIDVDAKDSKGLTALSYAVTGNRPALVRLLIKHGAKVNLLVASAYGREPALLAACRLGNVEVAQLLLDSGATMSARRKRDSARALTEAARFGRAEVVLLLSGSSHSEMSTQATEALEVAARHGRDGVQVALTSAVRSMSQGETVELSSLVEEGQDAKRARRSSRLSRSGRNTLPRASWLPTAFWRSMSLIEAAVSQGSLSEARALKAEGTAAFPKEAWVKAGMLSIQLNDRQMFDVLLDAVMDQFNENAEEIMAFWHEALPIAISSGFHEMLVDLLLPACSDTLDADEAEEMRQFAVDLCVRHNRPRSFSAVFSSITFDPYILNELIEVCATTGSEEMMQVLMQHPRLDLNRTILSRALAEAQRRGYERCAMALWCKAGRPRAVRLTEMSLVVDAARIGDYPLLGHAAKFALTELLAAYLALPSVDVNLSHGPTLRTPLTLSTSLKATELLIKDPRTELNATDVEGNCPMQFLMQAPFPRRVMGLAWGESNPYAGMSVLERKRVLELLMAQDRFDVNQVSNDGVTPAWHRCRELELIKPLVANPKLKVNARGLGGRTFLYTCVLDAKLGLEWFRVLVTRKDLDVNTGDEAGWNPLCLACRYAHEEILVRLLNHPEIDVNWKKVDGWTAFMLAAANGSHRIVNLLLNTQHKKVDLQAKNNNGQTALDLAVTFRKPQIADLLRRQGRQSRKRVMT